MQINTQDDARKVREIINAKLDELEAEHGLKVQLVGGAKYSTGTFECKIAATAEGAKDLSAQLYDQAATLYGLPALGTRLRTHDGTVLTITGWNRKAQKNKVLLKTADGRMFHGPTGWIKDLVSAGKVIA